MLVSAMCKVVNRLTDLPGVCGTESPQDRAGQDAEPALDLVEPGGVGGSVVEVHAGMAGQPPIMLGPVRVQVIKDDMEFSISVLSNDAIHEVQKLPSTPTLVVFHSDNPTVHLQGGKEGGGTVAFVLVSMTSQGLAIGETQPSLGPLQGLDGWFFVHTDNHCVSGGSRYSPTMSAALRTNWGAVLTHQLRRRCS